MPLCSPAIKNTVIEEANKIYIKINLYSTCIQVLVGAKCHGDKTNAMFKWMELKFECSVVFFSFQITLLYLVRNALLFFQFFLLDSVCYLREAKPELRS